MSNEHKLEVDIQKLMLEIVKDATAKLEDQKKQVVEKMTMNATKEDVSPILFKMAEEVGRLQAMSDLNDKLEQMAKAFAGELASLVDPEEIPEETVSSVDNLINMFDRKVPPTKH